MSKILYKYITAMSMIILSQSTPSLASSTNGYGRVTNIAVTGDGALLFDVDAATIVLKPDMPRPEAASRRENPPACAAGQSKRWMIDINSNAGQAAASTLLWAVEHQWLVSVTGTGRCGIRSDIETIALVNIQGGQ